MQIFIKMCDMLAKSDFLIFESLISSFILFNGEVLLKYSESVEICLIMYLMFILVSFNLFRILGENLLNITNVKYIKNVNTNISKILY